jgi:hypothetical protein
MTNLVQIYSVLRLLVLNNFNFLRQIATPAASGRRLLGYYVESTPHRADPFRTLLGIFGRPFLALANTKASLTSLVGAPGRQRGKASTARRKLGFHFLLCQAHVTMRLRHQASTRAGPARH